MKYLSVDFIRRISRASLPCPTQSKATDLPNEIICFIFIFIRGFGIQWSTIVLVFVGSGRIGDVLSGVDAVGSTLFFWPPLLSQRHSQTDGRLAMNNDIGFGKGHTRRDGPFSGNAPRP